MRHKRVKLYSLYLLLKDLNIRYILVCFFEDQYEDVVY